MGMFPIVSPLARRRHSTRLPLNLPRPRQIHPSESRWILDPWVSHTITSPGAWHSTRSTSKGLKKAHVTCVQGLFSIHLAGMRTGNDCEPTPYPAIPEWPWKITEKVDLGARGNVVAKLKVPLNELKIELFLIMKLLHFKKECAEHQATGHTALNQTQLTTKNEASTATPDLLRLHSYNACESVVTVCLWKLSDFRLLLPLRLAGHPQLLHLNSPGESSTAMGEYSEAPWHFGMGHSNATCPSKKPAWWGPHWKSLPDNCVGQRGL